MAGAGAQAQNIFTNIGTGFWSNGNSWQDAVTPAAGGSSNHTIVFNNTALDWSTNTLGTTNFLLNRIVFSGANVNLTNGFGTNLVFFANSSAALPQLNQTSSATNTIYIFNMAGISIAGIYALFSDRRKCFDMIFI